MKDVDLWTDKKGRVIEVHTMSNRWLNNIRKKYRGADIAKPIIKELKRRKNLRNKN